MKKARRLIGISLALIAVLVCLWIFPIKPADAATGVDLNSTNFPNSSFRSYVKSNYDGNKDNKLSATEIENATYIDVSYKNIDSLKGIEYLTSLITLDCRGNQLTSLNVASNTNLVELYCSENQIGSLSLSNNKELIHFQCENNALTTLNLTANTKLEDVYCGGNELTTLSINKCTLVTTLNCSVNKLKALDVSGLTNLVNLICDENQLSTLTLGSKPNLKWFTCSSNPSLSNLTLTNCPKILTTMEKGIREEILTYIRYSYSVGEDEYFFQFDASTSLVSPPEIIAQPYDVTALAGTSATFTISATGGALSYQWEYSTDQGKTWSNVSSGGTSSSYTMTAAMLHEWNQYRCVVTNSYGSTTSKVAHLIVDSDTYPCIMAQPEDQKVASGKTATFAVTTKNVTSFQWYYSRDNGASWVTFEGQTGAMLSVKGSATNNGCLYVCIIKNSKGSVQSYIVKLTVTGVKPGVYSQPGDRTREPGAEVSFYVGAMGVSKYQWQVSKDGGSTWKNISTSTYPSAATATLKFTTNSKQNGYMYRCKLTNSVGTTYSAKVTLTIGKPAITSQPSSTSAATGAEVSFKVSTSGAKSYQWQVSKDNGSTWTNISTTKYPSAATNTLTFTVSSGMQGYKYRCKVKNSEGTTTSSAAVLTVTNVKPKITTQPVNKTVSTGKTVKFTVAAVGYNMTYQWQVSKDGGSTWTNLDTTKYPSAATATLSFTASAKMNGYKYRCVVKSNYGNVNSSAAKLTVN